MYSGLLGRLWITYVPQEDSGASGHPLLSAGTTGVWHNIPFKGFN